MTTKKQKKLTLDDFIAPVLTDEPMKLFITLDGKETKEYLQVISKSHADMRRPIANYGVQFNKLKAQCADIEDEVDRVLEFTDGESELDKELASSMVVGWSLGEFNKDLLNNLLTGNDEIVLGIRAQSFTTADYTLKK